MKITLFKLPDISEYCEYICPVELSSDITYIVVLKANTRDDSVLADIYIDEISNSSKVVSGKKLATNGFIYIPNQSNGYNYYIQCVDPDGYGSSIKKDNAQNFYLQFTLYEEQLNDGTDYGF